MSETEHPADDDIEAPDLVHWSPRHGPTVGGPVRWPSWPLSALGLAAVVGVTGAALAVGVLAIGRLAVGRAAFKAVKIGRLEIGDLTVLRKNGRPF